MAIPNIKDFILSVNKALDGKAWNTNWQKLVNLFTSGQADVKFKSVEISQDGGIINNGSLTQSGNLSVTGNIEASGNLNVNGVISGDGSGLTGVVSAATIAYTSFCVNTGTVDSNGSGDLFNYTVDVSPSIEFKVGDGTGAYKPITFTNAKGKTTTLTAINSYDLSQTDNGTYIVYLMENATAVTLSDNGAKIYRQPTAPTSPSATDIWLDTSSEGLKSYIRQSGTWVESNIVVLGEVTIYNYKVRSATTYQYNWNGYNVNIGSCVNLQKSTEQPSVIVKSSQTTESSTERRTNVVFSNGYCIQAIKTPSGNTYTWTFDFPYKVTPIVVAVLNNNSGGGDTDSHILVNPTTTNCIISNNDQNTGFMAIAIGTI